MPFASSTSNTTDSARDSKFFGIPRYQPFIGGRSFNYEQKYPPDAEGEEASDEARVWSTYLDEAETYDHDMVQGFRDAIDSLLVLAGLFSAIVATFVAQTSQSLKPDFSQLNLLVQIEQNALIRTGGNVSAMDLVPSSGITAESPTYTKADLWINGLFFASLSLSMATALLAVLVKQWCQAYASVTPGSARDKWKLPEIVGSLPLLLHVAFAIFFVGLSYFVYDLHAALSPIVIISSIIAALLYFGTLLLPAIWLECPYHVPLLFRPARSVILFFTALSNTFGNRGSLIRFPILGRYLPKDPKFGDVLASLKDAEKILLSIPHSRNDDYLSPSMLVLARSLEWLLTLSTNRATQRIVTLALHGCFKQFWELYLDPLPNGRLPLLKVPINLSSFLKVTSWLPMAEVAFENAKVSSSTPTPSDDAVPEMSFRKWISILDVLTQFHSTYASTSPAPIPRHVANDTLLRLMMRNDCVQNEIRNALLRWGADVNNLRPSGIPGPLHAAIKARNVDNVQWLLDHGALVNEPARYTWGTPLTAACKMSSLEIVKVLVENGADVNKSYGIASFASNPLMSSLNRNDNLKIATFLLDKGAHVNPALVGTQDTPLTRAVENRNPSAVHLLLQRGATLPMQLKENLCRMDWTDTPYATRDEIEGMLRQYASRTMKLACFPEHRHGSILSRNFLA
ncbi:hypothetical protein DL96DRAFT_1558338 [Flagelloscypha sp. PMI_526]|nr:hypothetical protein DL96DRAFT_1558338 [Flagelloscypha sp. PMI_526]